MKKRIRDNKTLKYLESGIIIFALFVIVYGFYRPAERDFFSNPTLTYGTVLSVLLISVATDGFFLFLHLPRKPVKHGKLGFSPEDVTVLIACYNGEKVIGETIESALTKFSPENIIVASDASTDKTVDIARSYGVRVLDYKVNLNKAFTINRAIHEVKTKYVLLLDDDTLIADTFIPTSLLDEGYGGVAFNVIPVETGTLVNKFQMFEYRKSMILGKSLRAEVGGVNNVSGAIGLFRTQDLIEQDGVHSGQYGGEDQQRTILVHLFKDSKGITYTDSPVYTKVPNTWRALIKQRAKSWNLSCQELFFVYLKVILSPKSPHILKVDRAYQIYIVLTDPIRMFFTAFMIFHPLTSFISYVFYLCLGLISWLKVGRKDPLWIVFIFPIYSKILLFCRFHAYFHWYRVKYNYFMKRHHSLVINRRLMREYAITAVVFIITWILTFNVIVKNMPAVKIPADISTRISYYAQAALN